MGISIASQHSNIEYKSQGNASMRRIKSYGPQNLQPLKTTSFIQDPKPIDEAKEDESPHTGQSIQRKH